MESWSEKLITDSNKNICELKKKEVTKENFIKKIADENPKLLILNGHGDKTKICGYNREVLVEANKNEHVFKDKIIHTLACSAGDILGPKTILAGGIAYIGYKENFKAACSFQKTKRGQQIDLLAELFFTPAYLVVNELLQGKTVGEAYQASRDMYIKNLRRAVAHPDQAYNDFAASRLFHNINYQVCWGNHLAKL
ncbi:MAG: hypothetical protein V4665_00225 [Patescibacteria group bacterium]